MSQGVGVGDDEGGITHYVNWTTNMYRAYGGYWNDITWCSYNFEKTASKNILIRCTNQRPHDGVLITCVRCAARDPRDPRPWG